MGAVLPPSPRRLNARPSSWSAPSVRSVAGVFDILICRPVPSLALEGCPLVGRDDTGGATDPSRPRVSYVDDMRREIEILVKHHRVVPIPHEVVPDIHTFLYSITS